MPDKPKPRGFAAMSPSRRREIAARGGSAVPAHLRSFAQDRALATAAGRKGGSASRGSPKPGAGNHGHD